MSTLDFDRDKGRERKTTQKIIFVTGTYLSASKNCYFPEIFIVDNGGQVLPEGNLL